MDHPTATSDATAEPLPKHRSVGLGFFALALGLWTGCGSCLGVLSALSGAPPDDLPPFLSRAQAEAAVEFATAAASLGPVDGAIALAATLAGVALVVSAVFGFVSHPFAGTGLRVAFLVSAAVDALQALWMLGWFVLLWGDFGAYTRALMQDMPIARGDETDGIIAIAIGFTILLGLGYYAVKIALAVLGAWLARAPTPLDEAPVDAAGWAD